MMDSPDIHTNPILLLHTAAKEWNFYGIKYFPKASSVSEPGRALKKKKKLNSFSSPLFFPFTPIQNTKTILCLSKEAVFWISAL